MPSSGLWDCKCGWTFTHISETNAVCMQCGETRIKKKRIFLRRGE